MMMKDIKYIALCVALTTIALAGCSRFEEDDLFDESAALRIEHNAEKLQEILVNAPYGWVMQYHTGRGVAVFEGFNLFAKFEKGGKVTLAGDHRYLRDGNANKYTECASLYELIREDGLVLAFNTWNDVLTPFVDPVSYWAAPGSLLKDGEGMQGDQNLVVMSMSEDEVICRGERYDALIRLVKADRDWQTYISDTKTMKERITNSVIDSYYITDGVDTMYYVGLRNGRYRLSERVNNPLRVDSISCCFTPTGFRNERVDTLGRYTFQEFYLNEDASALVSEDGRVQVFATWDNYIINHSAVWEMDTELFTEEQQALFDQIAAEMNTLNKQWTLKSIGIGRSTGKNPVNGLILTYYTNTAKTKTNNAGLELTILKPKSKQMSLDCTEDNVPDNNLSVFTSRGSAIESLLRQFAATLIGTYDMTPNDYFLPTSVHCTPISSGTAFTIGS